MPLQNNRLSNGEYAANFSDIHPPLNQSQALLESNRCLFCYDAPCTKACPTHIDVAGFIKQISTGNLKGSAKTILDSNIFGGGCARVCPTEVLCEGACVHNLDHKKPIAIGQLQRYATDQALANNWQFYTPKPRNGKKVAVVGAGPAGLAAAHALACQGVAVTILEKEEKPGGLMTYGVAAYKVTPEFCAGEVNYILGVGNITVQYGRQLGKHVSLNELRKDFDAVFLGIGVGLARNLDVPGEHLNGVVNAMNFIYDIRTRDYAAIPVGSKVVVVGMGMTAIDAATQSARLGASEVTIVYRRTKQEMPCSEKEYELAKQDGCKVLWLAAPASVNGTDNVESITCTVMRLGEPDSSGRRQPVPTTETITIPADMVIKATGQEPYTALVRGEKLQDRSGKIIAAENGATNIPGVFAGGDCVNGGKEVVDAVQSGKHAALGMLEYLGVAV